MDLAPWCLPRMSVVLTCWSLERIVEMVEDRSTVDHVELAGEKNFTLFSRHLIAKKRRSFEKWRKSNARPLSLPASFRPSPSFVCLVYNSNSVWSSRSLTRRNRKDSAIADGRIRRRTFSYDSISILAFAFGENERENNLLMECVQTCLNWAWLSPRLNNTLRIDLRDNFKRTNTFSIGSFSTSDGRESLDVCVCDKYLTEECIFSLCHLTGIGNEIAGHD